MSEPRSPIGHSDLLVAPVALGCWPIAGVTSLDVNDQASRATLQRSLECGINHFDTAYCYGYQGESERLVGELARHHRNEMVIATKGGVHWDQQRNRVQDASHTTLVQECQESLQRLDVEFVDLYYLHAPDPNIDLRESAEGLKSLIDKGMTRYVGLSNVSVDQIKLVQEVCPVVAVQPPYNMLQRDIEIDLLPYCRQAGISAMIYWPLMKGLLAGKLPRDHKFQPGDGRAKYPMFQGEQWDKNQDFLDELRAIASSENKTVAQVVINWTFQQPGITCCLCGAKRPEQIEETAGAMGWQLSQDSLLQIEDALRRRGKPITKSAI